MEKGIKYAMYVVLLIAMLVTGHPYSNISVIAILIELVVYIYFTAKLIRKEKLIVGSMDYLVVILGISSMLPFILKTNVSMQNSINYIIKYITVIGIFFATKDILKKDKKFVKGINNVIIISGIILLVIGIDKMTTNLFDNMLGKWIILRRSKLTDIRLESIFVYANAFAAYIGFCFIISMGNYFNEERKINKMFYGLAECLCLIGIILSSSRILILSLSIVMLIYMFLNRSIIKKIIINVLINGIIAICYSAIFMKFIILNNFLIIWIGLLIASVVAIIANENIERLIKVKSKYYILILSIVIIFFLVGLFWKTELVLFETNKSENEVIKQIGKLKENEIYKFKIDLEANTNIDNNYSIVIQEKNRYFQIIKETKIEIQNDERSKEFEIKATEGATELFIKFYCNKLQDGNYLKIKSLSINGKEEALNYKYLPADIVNKFLKLNFNTKSVWERFYFYKDATKESKEHPLIGIGGGAWEFVHPYARTSFYEATEIHSYPVQLLLENGVIGFLAYIGILVLLIYKFYKFKEKNIEINSIFCATLLLVIHSTFDLEVSFFSIMILLYMYCAILDFELSDNKSKNSISPIILIMFVLFAMLINAGNIYAKYIIKPQIAKEPDMMEKIALQKKCISYNPALIEYKTQLIQQLQIYKKYKAISQEEKNELAIQTIQSISELYKNEKKYDDLVFVSILEKNSIELLSNEIEEGETGIDLLYKKFQDMEDANKYDKIEEIEKIELIEKTIADLSKLKNPKTIDFYNLAMRQIEVAIKRFDDYEACRITEERAKQIQIELKTIEERIRNGVNNGIFSTDASV